MPQTSVGYTNAISGSGGASLSFVRRPGNSGGAIRGWMPQTLVKVDKSFPEFEYVRLTLKESWNTSYPRQLRKYHVNNSIVTPFRAVNNAGDLMSRNNYSCGGPCQTFQSRPGLRGLRVHFGAVQKTCVPSDAYNSLQLTSPDVPAAACNVRYVYDASDYTRYLKQRAFSRNYNDLSYGGNDSKASQSAMRAIRRY
jgi:hypothetical protein